MEEIRFYIQVFVGLISVIDPFGCIPVFIGLTEDFSHSEKRKIARRTSIAVVVILLISALTGEAILHFFGIDIYSFKIAGGIVLLIMSLEMLHARRPGTKYSRKEHEEAAEKEDVAIVPLALPLLAGPGAISTVILFSHRMHWVEEKLILIAIILLAGGVVLLSLYFADKIAGALGHTGMNIANRIMGLILASISVQFILEGMLHKFPALR